MKNLETIIRYLDGEVIGEEKAQFEQKIKEDSSLQETVQLVKEVDNVLADDEFVSFISKIKETHILYQAREHQGLETEKNGSSIIKILFNKKLQIAASIAILLVVSTIFYINHFSSSSDALFENYYKPYEASLITRSSSPTDESDLVKAIQFYDKGNFTNAITKLEKVLLSEKDNTAAHFFIGVSYIETKDFLKAIENLNYVIHKNDTAFVEHAQWYLALCYLKNKQNNLAIPILTKIVQSHSFYQPMASELIEKLK